MNANNKRILIWTVISLLVIAGISLTFVPRAIRVDLMTVEQGPMMVTVGEEGETRVHDVFMLSAPVTGRMRRIDAHVGDVVVAGETVLASIEPVDPTLLDPRSEAQAKAAIQTAESAQALAQAEVDRVRADLEFARAEFDRAHELIADQTISQRDLDNADRVYKTEKAALATARAALQMRNFELEQARAQLLSPIETQARHGDCACIPLTSPVSGQVLRIHNESARVVNAGEPLIEVGDAADLEIVVDFLSSDAVQIEPGQRVIIDGWGGDTSLPGRVRRVEPFGYTKVSALGIEEQRVNVVIDLTSDPAQFQRLGHGYQVEAQVVLWEHSDVVTVPLTALFRDDKRWALFVNDNGRARLRTVDVGRRNGLVAEIVDRLAVDEQVVLHPSDRVTDGVRIAARGL